MLRRGHEDVAEAFRGHFSEVYKSKDPSKEVIKECVQTMEIKVTSSMSEELEKCFTKEELEVALKQMGPFKSPRPDGYSACFYQIMWSKIGNEISEAALKLLK